MKDKKDQLEQLIKQFQKIEPTPEQLFKWYVALQQKNNRRQNVYCQSLFLVAGMAIGIIIAGFLLKMNHDQVDENLSTTFTRISVKNLAGNKTKELL